LFYLQVFNFSITLLNIIYTLCFWFLYCVCCYLCYFVLYIYTLHPHILILHKQHQVIFFHTCIPHITKWPQLILYNTHTLLIPQNDPWLFYITHTPPIHHKTTLSHSVQYTYTLHTIKQPGVVLYYTHLTLHRITLGCFMLHTHPTLHKTTSSYSVLNTYHTLQNNLRFCIKYIHLTPTEQSLVILCQSTLLLFLREKMVYTICGGKTPMKKINPLCHICNFSSCIWFMYFCEYIWCYNVTCVQYICMCPFRA